MGDVIYATCDWILRNFVLTHRQVRSDPRYHYGPGLIPRDGAAHEWHSASAVQLHNVPRRGGGSAGQTEHQLGAN